jgi:hypothetical protein
MTRTLASPQGTIEIRRYSSLESAVYLARGKDDRQQEHGEINTDKVKECVSTTTGEDHIKTTILSLGVATIWRCQNKTSKDHELHVSERR